MAVKPSAPTPATTSSIKILPCTATSQNEFSSIRFLNDLLHFPTIQSRRSPKGYRKQSTMIWTKIRAISSANHSTHRDNPKIAPCSQTECISRFSQKTFPKRNDYSTKNPAISACTFEASCPAFLAKSFPSEA